MRILYVLMDGSEPDTCSFDRSEIERTRQDWADSADTGQLRIVAYVPQSSVTERLRRLDQKLAQAEQEAERCEALNTPEET